MRRLGFHRPDHPGNLRLATGLDRFARRIRDDDTIDDRRRGARAMSIGFLYAPTIVSAD